MDKAKIIENYLISFGAKPFLAHHMKKGSCSLSEIIRNIRQCDFFVCLFTDNYHKRDYTDQEFGIAYGLRKKIYVLKLTTKEPYGFIKEIQNLNRRNKRFPATWILGRDLIIELSKKTRIKLNDDYHINMLENVFYFPSMEYHVKELMNNIDRNRFTTKQINKIAVAYINNCSVHFADSKYSLYLSSLIKMHFQKIHKKYRNKLKEPFICGNNFGDHCVKI